MASRPSPVDIDSLPNELLAHIFSYLDGPAPSDSRLHDQPSQGLLESDTKDLKNTSRVSKRWRAEALPLLFHHVLWPLDRWDLLLAEQEGDPGASIPIISFIRDHGIGVAVQSLTMLVRDSMDGFYSMRKRDGEASTMHGGRLQPPGEGKAGTIRMADGSSAKATTYAEDNNWLWKMIFELIDPLRFTIIGSPKMLTSLMSRMLFLGDAWGFQVPYHILSLSRKDRLPLQSSEQAEGRKEHVEGRQRKATEDEGASASLNSGAGDSKSCLQQKRVSCDLFSIRPWTSLLLNEGSSTRVYRTYEFFLKKPPSILGALLGAEEYPNDEPLMMPSIRDFAYVGIFPLSGHVNTLVQFLPRLDKLFIQLVPRNNILSSVEEMKNIEPQDLWMERNTSYSLIMREMLQSPQEGNWAHLREFESGDAADKEAWEMAVEYVRLAGRGWRVGGEGVFLKQEENDEDDEESPDSSDSDTAVHSSPLFQGELTRISFNGTAKLPYSSMWLYSGAGAGQS